MLVFFFCNDLFENTLLVCCVYATNTLLQISLGKVVLVVFSFCMRHNLNMLLVQYLNAANTVLIIYDCPLLQIGLISEEDIVKIMDEKLKGKKYEEVLKLSVDEVDAKKKEKETKQKKKEENKKDKKKCKCVILWV